MAEEMEGIETIDLTNYSFGEFQNGDVAISDEDFAKRLQMEELETLRASDFLVAQQLQEEYQRDDSGQPNFDQAALRLNHENFAHRQHRSVPGVRRPRTVRPQPTNDPSDGAVGAVPVSFDALRLSRVQQAMMRNRTAQEAESSSQSSDVAADGDAGASDRDTPPPIPRRNRYVRRRAENTGVPDGRPRAHFMNGHRIHMLHPFIRGRDPYLHLLDFDDGSGNNYDALWDLSERIGDVGNKGLSKAEINLLPTVKYKTSEPETASTFDAANPKASVSGTASFSNGAAADDASSVKDSDCRICLNMFASDDLLRNLPCCHRFHVDCIDQWIKKNAICPVCRDDIKGHLRRHQDDWSHDDDFMS